MGEQFTAADVVIGANIRWGMIFKMIPERKEFTTTSRASARPAAQARRRRTRNSGAGRVSSALW